MTNPREQVNAITLRSGTVLGEVEKEMKDATSPSKVKEDSDEEVDEEIITEEKPPSLGKDEQKQRKEKLPIFETPPGLAHHSPLTKRSTRKRGKSVMNEREPSNPSKATPPPLDEARIRGIIQQVMAKSQGRVGTPVQDRQKSYANLKRKEVEFQVGDKVFLKVSPFKRVMRFGSKGKLAPRYVGPFEVLQRVGKVAYRLALSPSMDKVHDVFHVSMLRKYVSNPSHILRLEDVDLEENLVYEEHPIQILDRRIKELRNKNIPLVKVLWRNHKVEEATWEVEQHMQNRYPE
ncbi:uncharacterized protein LOC116107370, partial [Pistacia vera]|uniref:uncharacterized protein LOC116107370 n=1 Tax=Pistacia vera TaxID=55513 RepID=UPI001262E741